MPRRFRLLTFALLLAATGLGACAPASQVTAPGEEQDEAEAPLRDENLNSTLYVQTAAEYDALARQSYRLAEIMMRRALEDSSWTAFPEQTDQDGYRTLPPAVVLDVDETVLDNSPYQARLILENETYDLESWNDWVREESAARVPGALVFAQAAEAAGVRVFYLTNRRDEVEAATRSNLQKLGFPLAGEQDVLLTRGEAPFEDTSDKKERRRYLADDFRLLLLIGDNFGDFISGVDVSPQKRQALYQRYADYWGTRWIVLPNPQYGSWEAALYDFNYGLSRAEKLRRKRRRLDPGRGERQ